MAFFHLRTVPGQRWPALPDAVFGQVWNAYLELDRTQWLDRGELEKRQLKQVRTLLAHCIRHVPYYQRVLPAAGIAPAVIETMEDFRRIPLLTRRSYQGQTTSQLATSLPDGTTAAGTTQSSGSSGAPVTTYGTNMTSLWWHAFWLRDLEWCNLDPIGTLASIRPTLKTGADLQTMMQGVCQPGWSSALASLLQTGPVHVMDIGQDPRVQLRWLRGLAPDYLLSFPATLEALACLARQEGPIPGLRVIQSICDSLTPETRSVIESAFGVPVRDTYSCNEMGYLATQCPAGHGLHVHAENVLLEVLDEDGRPCAPGQTGRVHGTHLHNLRGPFVRYDLGDEATVGPEKCPCGRGLPLLTKILGRSYPLFPLPGGGTKHSAVVAHALRLLGGSWQHQLVQKSLEHVVVRIASDATWTARHADEVKRIVQEFFEAPIRVDVEIHDRLATPHRGKFRSMITEVTSTEPA